MSLLIGSNANEGGYFVPRSRKAAEYAESVRKEYGLLGGRVLDLYPSGADEAAARSQRKLLRDNWYGWQVWTWARLQSVTGHAKVYLYNFSYVPDSAAVTPLAALGTRFRAGRCVRACRPAAVDRHTKGQTYWTQFAATGDPNGRGLPEWLGFTEHRQHVMNLGQHIGAGQIEKDDLGSPGGSRTPHASAIREAYATKH